MTTYRTLLWPGGCNIWGSDYRQTSNIRRTILGNTIAEHLDEVVWEFVHIIYLTIYIMMVLVVVVVVTTVMLLLLATIIMMLDFWWLMIKAMEINDKGAEERNQIWCWSGWPGVGLGDLYILRWFIELWRLHQFYFVHTTIAWWRHQMEIFSALLALWAGNSPIAGEFSAQRPVTRGFHVFFDLRLNQKLSKQWRRRWFETPWCSFWRHCYVIFFPFSDLTTSWDMLNSAGDTLLGTCTGQCVLGNEAMGACHNSFVTMGDAYGVPSASAKRRKRSAGGSASPMTEQEVC